MEPFVISAELLNHLVFIELLNKSAQEYSYEQRGVLRILCVAVVFERVLETLRLGWVSSFSLRMLSLESKMGRPHNFSISGYPKWKTTGGFHLSLSLYLLSLKAHNFLMGKELCES
ncbi:putative small auxin-up RNA [Rosa chinensis]|uniref:Putative small auxin-up RNA n=1 Tax=Rosa chinensis TaxID=74649 RepID=A0A2P6S9Y5_ROSCH|nr:putative small auxin-up RNA [Rosa chinensis]